MRSLFSETHAERRKTDVRMPQGVFDAVEEMSATVGVPKNAYIVLAALHYGVSVLRLANKTKKRDALLKQMGKEFNVMLTGALKAK